MPELKVLKLSDLNASDDDDWIWDGYLAVNQITLFTARWKSGKTTLLSHLLAHRRSGGAFLGQKVAVGKSVVVTEEPPALWQERAARLCLSDDDRFICRPFKERPTLDDWTGLINNLARFSDEQESDLVILDPLSHVLPGYCENHPQMLLDALQSLRRLTDAGVGVLLVHHPRRRQSNAGDMARGCGALQAFVDIIMEMACFKPNDPTDARRRLLGYSRHADTPRSQLIELNAAATRYTCLDESFDDRFLQSWAMVRNVLSNAAHELTRTEILKSWPESYPRPSSLTLWRWLEQARERALVARIGAGSCIDPFRYFLPERLEVWKKDPTYQLHCMMLESSRHAHEFLQSISAG